MALDGNGWTAVSVGQPPSIVNVNLDPEHLVQTSWPSARWRGNQSEKVRNKISKREAGIVFAAPSPTPNRSSEGKDYVKGPHRMCFPHAGH